VGPRAYLEAVKKNNNPSAFTLIEPPSLLKQATNNFTAITVLED
jgi:hypothetical protein